MNTNFVQRCLYCKHWFALHRDGVQEITIHTVDECRFGPPTVVVVLNKEPASVWPITKGSDWCGQFELREVTSEGV